MPAMKDGVPSPIDQDLDAGKPLARNLSPHPALDALDPSGAETHVLRFAGGNLVHESGPLRAIASETRNVHPRSTLQQDVRAVPVFVYLSRHTRSIGISTGTRARQARLGECMRRALRWRRRPHCGGCKLDARADGTTPVRCANSSRQLWPWPLSRARA